MPKINFENPKIRVKADIILLVILTLFAFGLAFYNALLPSNTIISCDKSINECSIFYKNIFGNKSTLKNINFKISNIGEVIFVPSHMMSARSYKYANINISTKDNFYYSVVEPLINEDDMSALAMRINSYLTSNDNNFYFNRNEEVTPKTRTNFILGIIAYYFIALIFIIADIKHYKIKDNSHM